MKYLSLIISAPLLLTLSACGESDSERLFDACFEQGMGQGVEQLDQEAVEAGVTKVCTMFVTECESNPDGQMCASVKKKYEVE